MIGLMGPGEGLMLIFQIYCKSSTWSREVRDQSKTGAPMPQDPLDAECLSSKLER